MRRRRLRLILGVELRRNKPLLRRQLEYLDQIALGRCATKYDARRLELATQRIIHLVTMPMALADFPLPVNSSHVRSIFENARIRPQSHRSALFGHVLLFRHQVNHRVPRRLRKLRRTRVAPAHHIARIFDERHLHPQANPEKRHIVLARITHRRNLALGSADAKTTGHQYPIHRIQHLRNPLRIERFQLFAIDIMQLHPAFIRITSVIERFYQALIRLVQLHVFAHERNIDLVVGVPNDVANALPSLHIGLFRPNIQKLANPPVQILPAEIRRHHVNALDVARPKYARFRHIAKERQLAPNVVGHVDFASANQDIGLNPDLSQRRHAMLRRLRLELIGRANIRHQRHVNVDHIAALLLAPELPNRLQKRQRLDIAHRPADLDYRHIAMLRPVDKRQLNLIGYVRNDLHRPPQIVATTLFRYHAMVNPTRRAVVRLPRMRMRKPLVMPQIHIRFGAVLRHIHFAMLQRIHRARVDVDIRVELQKVDPKPATL